MKFLFSRKESPDDRAARWVELMNRGEAESVIQELRHHPDTLRKTSVPLVHLAILAGQADVLKEFLQHGADPNQPDRYGIFPIIMALQHASAASLITILLNAGAKPDVQDRFGGTVLMYAAQQGDLPVVEALLGHSSPNLRDHEGNTALMYAAEGNHGPVVEALLNAGADHSIRNFDGLSAVDKARDPEVVRLFQ